MRWVRVGNNLETGSQLAELIGVGEIIAFFPWLFCSNCVFFLLLFLNRGYQPEQKTSKYQCTVTSLSFFNITCIFIIVVIIQSHFNVVQCTIVPVFCMTINVFSKGRHVTIITIIMNYCIGNDYFEWK